MRDSPDGVGSDGSAGKPGRYRNYLLTVLLLVLTFDKIDYAAIGVLLQSIKGDLSLSDTELGLLTGIAFTLFYSVMGIPIARWADRGNRVRIISIAIGLHCAAVVLCGMVATYAQLLLVRIGVAVGEAGGIPPSNSLIADYFTRAERARATARYLLGYPLSSITGYFLAGWLNQLFGWRATFELIGLPGIVLALLAWFTLREPRVRRIDGGDTAGLPPAVLNDSEVRDGAAPNPDLIETCVHLWSLRTFRHLLAGYTLVTFFGIGIWLWAPTFFIRSFAMSSGAVGTWFAIVWGLGGLLGTYCGGELASRFAAANEPLQLRGMAFAFGGFGIISAEIFVTSNRFVALALLGLTAIANFAIYGPLFAIVQTLVPQRMRAMAIATIYLFANLFGVGLGSLAVGMLSDSLRAAFGLNSLRYALLILCPGYLWAAVHFWKASATASGDLQGRSLPLIEASTQRH